MDHGRFDDANREFVITDPVTPRPWINFVGNRRLRAFVSQNAGGLLWFLEPHSHRITRYHYLGAPPDRPGFYVYVRDRAANTLWNPHFAPTCTSLDGYECRHAPGRTSFTGEKDGVRASVDFVIPPEDDVMVWRVRMTNVGRRQADLQVCSYLEFSLLEFLREVIGWCYLKNQIGFRYDPALRGIRYDYHVFEAPDSPRMVFACTEPPSGFECSRDAFIGATGSLAAPAALGALADLRGTELPLGGHGAGVLAVDLKLEPGESREFSYIFAIGKTWDDTDRLVRRYAEPGAGQQAVEAVKRFWEDRLGSLQVSSDDGATDRFINTWNPYNASVCLDLARTISTDHMGMDGLRYRDTTQDALAVCNLDPDFAAQRMRQVFAQQTRDGGGCFAFYPDNPRPTSDAPHRSDNTVWQIYTIRNLVAETGNFAFLEEVIPYRDGGAATVYEHIRIGLRHIAERCGPHGLPTLFHADWNDGLALFQDEKAESVMLAMQQVYSCREFAELAERLGRTGDAEWCRGEADRLDRILNTPPFWDGAWYGRLLLSSGKLLGTQGRAQGQIYLNPQSWAVISGVGAREGRGVTAMQAVFDRLNTDCGIRLLTPPFTGIPEPTDPPLGSNPGIGENGGIFCHANTWAIIAEAMLGNAERAYQYYRQLLPEHVIRRFGEKHYEREPYVYASSIVGPPSQRLGEGGISWLTGTASWMYVAATQYLLGIRPAYDGLDVKPCLPKAWAHVRVTRRFRGCLYEIEIDHAGRGTVALEMDGEEVEGTRLPVRPAGGICRVRCLC